MIYYLIVYPASSRLRLLKFGDINPTSLPPHHQVLRYLITETIAAFPNATSVFGNAGGNKVEVSLPPRVCTVLMHQAARGGRDVYAYRSLCCDEYHRCNRMRPPYCSFLSCTRPPSALEPVLQPPLRKLRRPFLCEYIISAHA